MSNFSFLPIDQIGSNPLPQGAGLVPSLSRTQQIIDSLRKPGPGSVSASAQAREVETSVATGLGAILSGAAAANGFSVEKTAIAGAAVAAYGIMNGHPMLTNIGRGLVTPYLFKLGAKMFAPTHPPTPTAPPAPAPAAT